MSGVEDIARSEIEKLKIVRYEPAKDSGYTAILRDPKVDPSADEISRRVCRLVSSYYKRKGGD